MEQAALVHRSDVKSMGFQQQKIFSHRFLVRGIDAVFDRFFHGMCLRNRASIIKPKYEEKHI